MKRTNATDQICVGDLRLSAIDVGFDLRLHDIAVQLPETFESVGLDQGGKRWLIEGTREEMIAAIKAAGYACQESA